MKGTRASARTHVLTVGLAFLAGFGIPNATQMHPAPAPTSSGHSDVRSAQVATVGALPKPKQTPAVRVPLHRIASTTGTVLVLRVIDGDTIEIAGGERVRYIGIDTPETVKPYTPVQCFGHEASAQNKSLVEGKYVRLIPDVEDRDKYDRLLRYVYVGDTFVNLSLVQTGYAHAYTYPPNVAHVNDFKQAETQARISRAGLWGNTCNGVTSTKKSTLPLTPSTVAPENILTASTTCTIKGNISSSGEKIYHTPACPYYSRTKIETAKGERLFCTEGEAEGAGWRKAINCP